jgi:hypothetical protein
MNQSYVGVITAEGLQAIYRESDHLVRFLERRLYRSRPVAGLCYWAVLADRDLEHIELQIQQGESRAALRALEEAAEFGGVILPTPQAGQALDVFE